MSVRVCVCVCACLSGCVIVKCPTSRTDVRDSIRAAPCLPWAVSHLCTVHCDDLQNCNTFLDLTVNMKTYSPQFSATEKIPIEKKPNSNVLNDLWSSFCPPAVPSLLSVVLWYLPALVRDLVAERSTLFPRQLSDSSAARRRTGSTHLICWSLSCSWRRCWWEWITKTTTKGSKFNWSSAWEIFSKFLNRINVDNRHSNLVSADFISKELCMLLK